MIHDGLKVDNDLVISLQRIKILQEMMHHPLGRYVYFVHGFFGSDDDFTDMINWLDINDYFDTYEDPRTFSYFDGYGADTSSKMNDVHWQHTISDFALNLADELLNLPSGSQVSIVAHSMGGIITREMLRLKQDDFDSHDIDFGRIITLGSPHLGTPLANPVNPWNLVLAVIYLAYGNLWPSPVFWSLMPNSPFLTTLNQETPYIQGAQSYLIGGVDLVVGPLMTEFMSGNPISDGIVPLSSATGIWATGTETFYIGHNALVDGSTTGRETYPTIASWLNPTNDYDGDGLTDEEERYYYGTNMNLYDTDQDGLSDGQEVLTYDTDPCDSDSDNDGLSDGSEVNTYSTDPLDAYSDGDVINDGNEIAWGYDPLNSNSPIPASSLIYSAWQSAGKVGCVRANHYTAMDYVKVYVKYKTSYGYWTSYSYVGSDSSPTYYGDYYVSWSFLSIYVQMKVKVEAYDASNHYLGSDVAYVTLPGGGGGGELPE